MDILVPFIVGLIASGIIWGTATVLDKKQKKKEAKTAIVDELYDED